jgi:uncharacterized membrane protein
LEEDNAIPSPFTGAFAGCLFLFFHLLIFHPFSLTFLFRLSCRSSGAN